MKAVPTEHEDQVALFQWRDWAKSRHPELEAMFAIPNGILKNAAAHAKFKAEGFSPGLPDVMFPVSRHGFIGLAIEMKRIKGGKVSEDQRKWLALLQEHGWRCEVCKGFDAAKQVLEDYLRDLPCSATSVDERLALCQLDTDAPWA